MRTEKAEAARLAIAEERRARTELSIISQDYFNACKRVDEAVEKTNRAILEWEGDD